MVVRTITRRGEVLELNEKSVSKKQQRLFGMVRATQKGEMENPSPEVAKIASTVSKSDVKKMASTKHTGLPLRKIKEEIIRARMEGPQKGLGAALCPTCGQMGCTKDHEAEKEEEVKEAKEKDPLDTLGCKDPDPRSMKTKVNLMKNKLRARGLNMSHELEGESHIAEKIGGAGTPVRQGIKVGGKKGGRAVQKGTTAATAAGRDAVASASQGGEGAGKGEQIGAALGGAVGGAAGFLLPDGPAMVAGEIAGGIAGAKVGGEIGKKFDGKKEVKPLKRYDAKEGVSFTSFMLEADIGAVTGRDYEKAREKNKAKKVNPKTGMKLRKSNVRTRKKTQAEADAIKARPPEPTPKRKIRLKKPSELTRVTGASKPAPKKETPKAKAAPAPKKTPVTKATVTKPEPKKTAPKKKPAAMKKAVERKKEVIKQPEKKTETKSRPSFKDFVAKGRKRHRKATQAARVLAKGAAAGVKKAVKVAKDIHSVTQVNKDKTVNMQSYEPELPMLEGLSSEKSLVKKRKNRRAKDLIKTGKSLNAQDLKTADEDGDGIVRVIDAGYTPSGNLIESQPEGNGKKNVKDKVKKVAAMIRSIRSVKPPKHDYGRDAGAEAAKIIRDKEHQKYVNFLPADD